MLDQIHQKIIETADGSHSIYLEEINESYHSKHGAVLEAKHVFIENGLYHKRNQKEVSIFEIGFGTGLNAFITLLESKRLGIKKIHYTTIEKFPLTSDFYQKINHFDVLSTYYPEIKECPDINIKYKEIHDSDWEVFKPISGDFIIKKVKQDISVFNDSSSFDLIYFDAFGPRVQPEIWTVEIFEKMYKFLKNDGILVTYCCKGQVRRNMIAAGFVCEKLPGPPGKREMLSARKSIL